MGFAVRGAGIEFHDVYRKSVFRYDGFAREKRKRTFLGDGTCTSANPCDEIVLAFVEVSLSQTCHRAKVGADFCFDAT